MGGRGLSPSGLPTVGIVGGGQLARMMHQAAIGLGVQTVVLTDDPAAPALSAGADLQPGGPERYEDLLALAERCDVLTLDHEGVPAELLDRLADRGHRVAPGAGAARLGRDKAEARLVLGAHGVSLAPWALTDQLAEIEAFAELHGWPLVLKAPTGGYDGRGVQVTADAAEAEAALAAAGGRPLLVEPMLPFRHELAVMVARSWSGEAVAYPPVETVQRDGQCHEVLLPAPVPLRLATEARQIAVRIAEAVELVGVMAVELFVVDDRLLLNELAVRPHNSAHLTIEACTTSQFENHLRAVLDLPLGATDPVAPAAVMVNVLGLADGGDPFDHLAKVLAVPGAHVHRYGKEARPNRKIGHITALGADLDAARATAERAAGALGQATAVPA